ncbi:MAG: NAD(P)H-dependent oxidoreductase [Candidatus Atabeyarchaeum deiterrae]
MAKILIVYDSKSGNTEKMAHEVAEGAKMDGEVEVLVKKVEETSLEDLTHTDGIIMGSPTYYGQMSSKLKALIDTTVKIHGKLEGKIGGAFTSAGGTATGAETAILSILYAMLVHGMIVQGRSDNKHYGAACVGPPRDNDVKNCRELGHRIGTLVKRLASSTPIESPGKVRKK